MSNTLPERASAVVIGGGVTGASVAYHLAKLGWNDVLLLERNIPAKFSPHVADAVRHYESPVNPIVRKLLQRAAVIASSFGALQKHSVSIRSHNR